MDINKEILDRKESIKKNIELNSCSVVPSDTKYESISAGETNLLRDESNDFITKSHIINFTAVAAIVVSRDNLLLGLCNCDDERHGKWCFPGGGIDLGEECTSAAIREVYEEMGIICKPLNQIVFQHPTKPTVGFVFLEAPKDDIKFNDEYFDAQWFSIFELPYNIMDLNHEIINIFFGQAILNDV